MKINRDCSEIALFKQSFLRKYQTNRYVVFDMLCIKLLGLLWQSFTTIASFSATLRRLKKLPSADISD